VLQDLKKQTALRLAQEQQQTLPEEIEQQANERKMQILPPENAHVNRRPNYGAPQNFVDVNRMNEASTRSFQNVGSQRFSRYDGQTMVDNTSMNRDRMPFKSSQVSPTLHIVSQSQARFIVITINFKNLTTLFSQSVIAARCRPSSRRKSRRSAKRY
jgi:hypothetical protein